MSYDGFVLGAYNAICDVCGFKFKSFQLRKRWDGLMVCSKDFEHRHPQDLAKVPKESPPLPWTRPEPADVYIAVTYFDGSSNELCTYDGTLGKAGFGTAGCAKTGVSA